MAQTFITLRYFKLSPIDGVAYHFQLSKLRFALFLQKKACAT